MAYMPTQELELKQDLGLSLEDTETQAPDDQGLSLDPQDNSGFTVDEKTARTRARKAHKGLGQASPGVDVIQHSIMSGQEHNTRDSASSTLTAVKAQENQQKLVDMAKKGTPVTPGLVKSYLTPEHIPSDIVFEKTFADQYVKGLLDYSKDDPRSPVQEAIKEDPIKVQAAAKVASGVLARRQAMQSVNEDLHARYAQIGWGSTIWNFTKTLVPFQSSIVQSPDWNPGNILLPGQSIESERDKYWSFRTPEEAKRWYEGRIRQIEASNPLDAIAYAHKMQEMSLNDKFEANLFGVLDAEFGGTTAVSGAKVAASFLGVKRLLRGGLDAVKDGTLKADNVLAAQGDIPKAAQIKAAKRVMEEMNPIGSQIELEERVRSYNNPSMRFNLGPGELAKESADRIALQLKADSTELITTIQKSPRAARTPDELDTPMLHNTAAKIERDYPSINDTVHEYGIIYQTDASLKHAEVKILKPDGSEFRSPEEATKFATVELGIDLDRFTVNSAKDALNTRSASRVPVENITTITGFKTAKGSTYKVNPDGTTTRNKAARKKHPGNSGVKENSARTVYVSKEDARALAPIAEANWRYLLKGETISLISRTHERPWRLVGQFSSDITYHTKPDKGLIPVELWRSSKLMGGESFSKVHFGNEITELTTRSGLRGKDGFFDTVPHGEGFYISITKPFDETEPMARQMLITTNNKNPSTIWNWLFGKVRSAEDLLAKEQREARHIATNVPKEIERVVKEHAKKLGRSRTKELDKVIIANRDHVQAVNGKIIRGLAHKNQDQFEKNFLELNGRLPTEKESYGYWKYHQMMDFDYILRNYGATRDLVRQGVELYTIPIKINIEGKKPVDTEVFFPGKTVDDIPWTDGQDPGILFLERGNNPKFYFKTRMGEDVQKYAKRLISEGQYRVIQIANPTDRPLQDVTGIGNIINFVLVREFKSKPLPMNLVDYSPGVHIQHPQGHKVAQPVMHRGEKGRLQHFGDKTIFGFHTQKQSVKVAKDLDDLRKLIKNEFDYFQTSTPINRSIVDNFVLKSTLPKDGDFWRQQFDPSRGVLSLEDPISHTVMNKSIFETYPHMKDHYPEKIFHERETSYNLFRSINVDFMADRDGILQTVKKGGTAEKPIYTMEAAESLDPYMSLHRALHNSINTLITNDTKIGAIEQFVAQYADLMKDSAMARANPVQTFYSKGMWDESLAGEGREELQRAKAVHDRITHFVGTKSEFGKDVSTVNNRLMNLLGERGARYYDTHELRAIKDPIAFTRSVMFHVTFGFFNIKQFLVQANGFTHVVGVTLGGPVPTSGLRGFSAYMLQRAGLGITDDPKIIDRYATMATKFGWKKDHFIESYRAMRNSGFDIIGREHAMRDDYFDPASWTNAAGSKFIAAGDSFFTEGEKLVTMTAWNAAYYEWRSQNPLAELTDRVIGTIQRRADDLRVNMTKASHSGLQEGWKAFPTQFYTFSQRILEQFWGGRLTPREKATAFLTHSAMYGAPVALGAAIPWPFYDDIRQAMLLRGSNLIDETWYKVATEGATGYLAYLLTGENFNIGQRYGPGFSDTLQKIWQGEATWADIMLGASGTFVENSMKSMYPFWTAMYAGMNNESFELTMDDIKGVFTNIKSLNDYQNAYYVYNTGKYISKAGRTLADGLTVKDSIGILMGLTNQKITDAFLIQDGLKNQEIAQDRARILAGQEIRRALQAGGDNNWRSFETHYARAMVYAKVMGDLNTAQLRELFRKEILESQTHIESIRRQMTTRGFASQIPHRVRRLLGIEQ